MGFRVCMSLPWRHTILYNGILGYIQGMKDQWINGEPDSRNEITRTGDHREIGRTVLETNLVASDKEASCTNCKENIANNMDLG